MIAELSVFMTQRLVSIALAAIVVLTTIEMIRRRKLREEYALLWLAASLALTVLAIFPDIPIRLNRLLNIDYQTIVMILVFLFLGMIVMHFAVVISSHAEQIRQLAQQVAILENQLRQAGQDAPAKGAAPQAGAAESRP